MTGSDAPRISGVTWVTGVSDVPKISEVLIDYHVLEKLPHVRAVHPMHVRVAVDLADRLTAHGVNEPALPETGGFSRRPVDEVHDYVVPPAQ